MLIFSEKVSRTIKVKYLKAIFEKDASWFDNKTYTQLSADME
jgi:hypothetical protein